MKIAINNTPLTQIESDLLVVAVTDENQAERLAELDSAFDGQLLAALAEDKFKAKAGASASYPTFGAIPASRLVVVGMGDGGNAGLQQAAGKAAGRHVKGAAEEAKKERGDQRQEDRQGRLGGDGQA